MRSSSLVALWAAAASAQSTVTVMNLFYPNDTTLTFKGSDASATTYYHACSISTDSAGAPSISKPTTSQGAGTITLLPLTGPPTNFPAQTAKARLRRDIGDGCEPYTIVQGPSTYQFHLTDPVPGALTIDFDCKLGTGGILSGDATCSGTADGSMAGSSKGTTTLTYENRILTSLSAFVTANVVSATDTATPAGSVSGSGTPTTSSASGSGTTPTASASGSGTTPGAQSTGLAASVPLPTGAIAFVGGAAGLVAAVIAL